VPDPPEVIGEPEVLAEQVQKRRRWAGERDLRETPPAQHERS